MTELAISHSSPRSIRIGFVTDLSGPYEHVDGQSGVEAIRMAIADATRAGWTVGLFTGDHQNNADVAVDIATKWFDEESLDVLIGGVNSLSSLGMAKVAQERKKLFLAVGAGSTAHTNRNWSPYTIHYAYDTTSLGRVLGGPVVQAGGDSWFFLSADYPIGGQLMAAASTGIEAAGGSIIDSACPPRGTKDFEPFLKEAMASGAKVLGLSNTHYDIMDTLRAANALGVRDVMTVAATFMFLTEMHQVGLEAAQGLYVSDSWYWNRDEETRAWSRRFFERRNEMPTSIHAGNYSAALQYLSAVEKTGTTDTDAVLDHLRANKINDMYVKDAYIRADGRVIHDMYVYRVKSPSTSVEPWDYYELVGISKGEAAWMTKAESVCPAWK